MRATQWEFKNRALVFGLIFAAGFCAYGLDPQMAAAVFSNRLGAATGKNPDAIARSVLAFAAVVLFLFALVRTWASAYLQASIVYASHVKSDSLVADGPYRLVRNPLYFANVLMSIGLGLLMSRTGLVIVIAAMVAFCYRLIFREEDQLLASQGERFRQYRSAVPRLWPALKPRIPSAGAQPMWREGFKAEFWAWGYTLGTAAFAVTLSVPIFLGILTASVVLLWVGTAAWSKKARVSRPVDPQR
jgi:protein-S-isoprenylcysteine O-methyltransferase Ste14